MLCTALAAPAEPLREQRANQVARWRNGRVDPHQTIALDKLVTRYLRTKTIYDQIEAMVPNGVPALVAFASLYRESDNDMTRSPAQGDRLTHRSVNVPRGRIPGVPPPYTFLQAARDAYYAPDLDHLQTKHWNDAGALLDAFENFNGGGYRRRGLASPYLWNGVIGPAQFNYYTRGKYVADGKWSATFKDPQLGGAAIWMRARDRGVAIPAALMPGNGTAKQPSSEVKTDTAGAPSAHPPIPASSSLPSLLRGAKFIGDFLRGLLP